jgi:GAF domain-containing protein
MRQRPKPSKLKAKLPVAPKPLRAEDATVLDLEKRLAEALTRESAAQGQLQIRDRELAETHEQQTATAEILDAISRSPTDLQPILEAVAQNASRLCGAANVSLYRVEGDQMRKVAEQGRPLTALRVGEIRPITRTTVSGRAIVDRTTIHLPDHQSAEAVQEYPDARRDSGIRTTIGIPLLREGIAIGVFTAYRTESRPFTEREIALLQTFANQAAIAIENVRLFNETKEALEQQTATSEILKVISNSPTDVQPVFDTISRSAAALCAAEFGGVFRYDGQLIHLVARNSPDKMMDAVAQMFPMPPSRGGITARAILERQSQHVPDITDDPEYAYVDLVHAGFRSTMSTPMLQDGTPIGAITVARSEPRDFTRTQIALLQTFADQAVIAIENVRLFKELEARNRDLTATGEILQVISRSPTDAQPVFDTIADNAVKLFRPWSVAVYRFDGEFTHVAAVRGGLPGSEHYLREQGGRHPTRDVMAGRCIIDRSVVHVSDFETDPDVPMAAREIARVRGFRATINVPMLKDGEPIGVISVSRAEAGAFSQAEIDLLQTFADQAVIAIENVRLFTELQEKNQALTAAHAQVSKSLEQQTATAEILRVISQSQTELQPVFEAIIDHAMRLFKAWAASILLVDGQLVRLIAMRGGVPGSEKQLREQSPWPLHTPSPVTFCIASQTVVHIPDIDADHTVDEGIRALGRTRGWRSILAAPIVRDGQPIGAISIQRAEAGAFSSAEVELLNTFTDQAVIAIENARLLGELRARTGELTRSVDQLTALGEVGRAVSSTLDLETVLTTIVARAVELSGLDGGVVYEYDEATEEFIQRVATETGGALAEVRRTTRFRKGEGVLGRTAITLEPVQVPDITVPGAYESRLRENVIASGIRAILAVPMVREDRLIGCLAVTRNHPGEFPSVTIELLRTFATQSALAIQNARLFREIEEKSRQLEAASQHKSEFLANMSHELRTPLNAIIGFSEVLTDRMFGDLNEKQEEYLKDIYASGTHLLSLINDILDLSKIEAGRMELESTDFHLPTALDNALTLVRERAGRRNIALYTSVDERLGEVRADERKIRQVVLNLLSNAIKFTPEGGRIAVEAVPRDGSVEVSVSDTGVGIAPADQEAVFEEFRQVGTADKKAEGTGLGLTLCRKFVELHGGRIWVKSQLGAGSTFTFTIPVHHGE